MTSLVHDARGAHEVCVSGRQLNDLVVLERGLEHASVEGVAHVQLRLAR